MKDHSEDHDNHPHHQSVNISLAGNFNKRASSEYKPGGKENRNYQRSIS